MQRAGFYGRVSLLRLISFLSFIFFAGIAGFMLSCNKPPTQPKPEPSRPSDIKVEVRDGGPIVVTTSTAEFQILPSGYLQATLLKDGKRLTLDDPAEGSAAGSGHVMHGGKDLEFISDFGQVKVLEASGKLGRGKRVEFPARPLAPAGVDLERSAVLEVYDDFPSIALVSVAYKNTGTTDFQIDQVVTQLHRFNNHEVKERPYDMWSFQGSSYDWGKDDVQRLTRTSAQPNLMGEAVKGGLGGGIPVVAFWTGAVGEAIGHVETLPLTLSIPVKVEADGRVSAEIAIPANTALKPGESYSTPRTFVSVYSGDYYEPLRI